MKAMLTLVSAVWCLVFSHSLHANGMNEPLPMLTIEELGQMDLGGRLQYLELYRDTYLDLEKMQKAFGQKIALNAKPEQRFWNPIFEFAEAQATFTRGGNVADRCIWAGNFQTYTSKGVCQRPGCSQEEEMRQGSGSVKCGLLATGSSECLSSNLAGNSTAECVRRAQSCASKNSSAINTFLSSYDANKPDVINLVRYACDPLVMAHLVRYVGAVGTGSLPPQMAAEFSRFNVNSEGLNGMVKAYQDHCSAVVDPAVIKSLPAAARERAQKMTKATVADVVQPQECRTLNARINALKGRYENLSSQMPRQAEAVSPKAVGAPVELVPKKGEQSVTVKATPPPPPPAVTPAAAPSQPRVRQNNPGGEGKVLQTSCPINPHRNMISNRAMACATCVTDAQGLRGPSARKYSTAGTSSKWLSLIATMGPVCRGKVFNAKETMQFLQGLGHCSAQSYDWSPKELVDGSAEKTMIRNWQVGYDLKSANSKKFGEIYGIDYHMAKNIFCPGIEAEYSRFGKDEASYWVQRASKVTEMDFKYNKESSDASFAYSKSGVHKCLTEAKQNGTQLNLAQFDKECQTFANAPAAAADYAVAKMDLGLPVVAVNNDNPDECWVSQYSTLRLNAPSTATFINPISPVRESNNSFDVIQYNSGSGANPKMTSMITLASKNACTKQSQVDKNFVKSDPNATK